MISSQKTQLERANVSMLTLSTSILLAADTIACAFAELKHSGEIIDVTQENPDTDSPVVDKAAHTKLSPTDALHDVLQIYRNAVRVIKDQQA